MSAIAARFTAFEKVVLYVEAELVAQNGEQIKSEAADARLIGIGAMAISAAIACTFARIAFAAMPASYVASTLLLVPSAAFALATFDCYKVIKCCSIILERASQQAGLIASLAADLFDAEKYLTEGRAEWVSKLAAEVDSSFFLASLSRLK